MKVALAFVVLWLAVGVSGQQSRDLGGQIHGIVVGNDGRFAKNMRLVAIMQCHACAFWMSETVTNDAGEYRFQHLPLGRKYAVFSDNTELGYPRFGPAAAGVVEITIGHPVLELRVDLPPLNVVSPAQEQKPDVLRSDDISTFLNEGWKITGDNHSRLVSGIWVSKKDPTKSLASNPQQVRIRCTVIDLKCKETSVNLMVSTEEIKDEDWNITTWDSHKLIASHGDDAANPCQRHVLTMNIDSGAVSASDIPTHHKGCEAFTDTESYDFVRVSSGVVQPIQKH